MILRKLKKGFQLMILLQLLLIMVMLFQLVKTNSALSVSFPGFVGNDLFNKTWKTLTQGYPPGQE